MVWGLTSINHLTHPTWLPSKRPSLNTTTGATVSRLQRGPASPVRGPPTGWGQSGKKRHITYAEWRVSFHESRKAIASSFWPWHGIIHPVKNMYNYIPQVSLWLLKNMIASWLDVYESKIMNWIGFYFIRKNWGCSSGRNVDTKLSRKQSMLLTSKNLFFFSPWKILGYQLST